MSAIDEMIINSLEYLKHRRTFHNGDIDNDCAVCKSFDSIMAVLRGRVMEQDEHS